MNECLTALQHQKGYQVPKTVRILCLQRRKKNEMGSKNKNEHHTNKFRYDWLQWKIQDTDGTFTHCLKTKHGSVILLFQYMMYSLHQFVCFRLFMLYITAQLYIETIHAVLSWLVRLTYLQVRRVIFQKCHKSCIFMSFTHMLNVPVITEQGN